MLDNEVTVVEYFELPSKGLIYNNGIELGKFKMRSMTTVEEMKRLSHSEDAYRLISEIIDDCILDKLGVSAYDMHIGDYQYLLHRLRVVTYGSEYKVTTQCPYCGHVDTYSIDLDSLDIIPYNEEEFKKYSKFMLPVCKQEVELRFQTPRMLDKVESRKREVLKRNPNFEGNPSILFTVCSLIKSLDGKPQDPIKLEQKVRSMAMADVNKILQYGMKLNSKIGIQPNIANICTNCGVDYNTPFRLTSEFFGPSFDD